MREWEIKLEIWPYATGTGRDGDQKLAGDRNQAFTVTAHDASEALQKAQLIVDGIKTNPHVWHVPITSIVQKPH